MESKALYLIPIISIINFCYLFYELKTKHLDKSEKKDLIKNNISVILTVIAILLLSIFIEYNMGKIFQILIIILGIILTTENSVFQDKLFYFLAVAGIVSLYVYRNNYIRGLILLIILIIIITFEILQSKDKNINKRLKFRDNLKCFLEGLLLTSLILIWGEYGKEPKLKYIKLFLRR